MSYNSYDVKHLNTGDTYTRPWVLYNDNANNKQTTTINNNPESQPIDPSIEAFHKTLPDYNETQLHNLQSIASELGFKHVFLKDESTRFGLPAFKILGASWAIHRTVCQRLGLEASSTSFEELKTALQNLAPTQKQNPVRLVLCTEGNWGRASARMARYLNIPVRIYVPGYMNPSTQELLRGEGAEVIVLENGTYDDTIEAIRRDGASGEEWLMVMDTSWEGYTEIPQWVSDGYRTMLTETDRQIAAQTGRSTVNLAFASVGVGSWAQAVVAHYKAQDPRNKIIAVEPESAQCFKEALHCDRIVTIATGNTIMNGMNCGTTSTVAWPILRAGTHAAVVVTDGEAHECVGYLQSSRIHAGPCGAATLAALKKFSQDLPLETRRDTVVVLFSTEGTRQYKVPE